MQLPTQESLLVSLQNIRNDHCTNCACPEAPDFHNDSCSSFVAVRLRVDDDDWEILTGDPSFDTNHKGHWGASTVGFDDDDEVLTMAVDQMIGEAEESIAMAEADEPY